MMFGDAKRAYDRGYQDGHEDGYQKGYVQGRASALSQQAVITPRTRKIRDLSGQVVGEITEGLVEEPPPEAA